ncbi:hypothetical protein, partial [Enterococcus faecalis]|uniref:hypothetical protein n=1 Tax=Enterococcus faecalis TaxID=1351 RepID=UPI003CC5E7A5
KTPLTNKPIKKIKIEATPNARKKEKSFKKKAWISSGVTELNINLKYKVVPAPNKIGNKNNKPITRSSTY